MSELDLIVRGGAVVTASAVMRTDVGIADGKVVGLAPELEAAGAHEIDARGLHVLPGVIDSHVHLNDPGRADWEGWQSGTRALAAGGATTALDMPLNSVPPTTTAAAFDAKVAAADGLALIDYGLWGGIVPGNLEELAELRARGAVGFKAFMCETGVPEFARADDLTLYEGMLRAAQLGAPVAVHAENDAIATGLGARARAEGRRGARDYLASRPVVCEVEAIGRAITLAEHAGCALHIVHVSSGAGVTLVAEARARGVDVSCETCPHYLALTDEDVERLGAIAKCSPPIRDAGEQRALWRALAAGTVPMLASDHSPSPPSMKRDAPDFDAAWGGIPGCQSMLEILLSEGHHRRGLPLERIARATSEFAARRFGLLDKGQIAAGFDADLTIVDLDSEHTQAAADLHYRHPQSAFLGVRLRGRVACAIVRGVTVAERGKIVAPPQGRLVQPGVRKLSASTA